MKGGRAEKKRLAQIAVLVFGFWLSGLIVLAQGFVEQGMRPSAGDLPCLTLGVFGGYALGSLIAALLTDRLGRSHLFVGCAVGLAVAALLVVEFRVWGYLVCGVFIAPLNNLSFVFVNENAYAAREFYSSLLLAGWSLSQVCIALYFALLPRQKTLFSLVLAGLAAAFCLASALFISETTSFSLQAQAGGPSNSPGLLEPQAGLDSLASFHAASAEEDLSLPAAPEGFPLKRFLGLLGGMVGLQFVYYRSQFTLDRFGVSGVVNLMAVGSGEAVTNLVILRLLVGGDRRVWMRWLLAGATACVLALVVVGDAIAQTCLEGVLRVAVASMMAVMSVWIPENFVTRQRGRATNLVMMGGVIGAAFSGLAVEALPFIVLAGVLAAVFLCTFLVSSRNKS